jgi:hypothetical protein
MDLIDIIRDDKVSKEDIYSFIPDQNAINQSIREVVQQSMEEVFHRLEQDRIAIEKKLVQLN